MRRNMVAVGTVSGAVLYTLPAAKHFDTATFETATSGVTRLWNSVIMHRSKPGVQGRSARR